MTSEADAPASGRVSNVPFVALALFILAIFLAAQFNPDMIGLRFPGNPPLSDALAAGETGLLGRRVALALLAAVAAAWLFWRGTRSLRLDGPVGLLVIAALVWSVASVIWADEPGYAARKIAVLVCMWTGALWVAALVPPERMPALTILLVLSVLALCFGMEVYDGTFRPFDAGYRFGGYYHPNVTGRYLAFGVYASTVLLFVSRRRVVPLSSLAICACFLCLTKSRTSFFSALAGLIATGMLSGLSSRRAALRVASVAGIVLIITCIAYAVAGDSIGRGVADWVLMGRDPAEIGTLTHRTTAWAELLGRYVPQQPFVGYGYDAFWTTKHIVAMALVVPGAVFVHSHSGYLELLLGVGIIGATLHVGYMLGATFTAVRHYVRQPAIGSAFAFGILAMLLTGMLAEPVNSEVSLPTFLTMAVIARLAIRHRSWLSDARGVGPQPCV